MLYTNEKLPLLSFEHLPQNLDITNWEEVKGFSEQLLNEHPASAEELILLLEKASELHNALSDELSWRYIKMTLNADDESYATAYNDFYSKVYAQTEPYKFKLQKLFYDSPFVNELDPDKYMHLKTIIEGEIKLFREENIPLMIQESELANRYGSIVSQMTATIDGEEKTVSQLAVYLKDPDRSKREEAWRLRMGCYQAQKDNLDKLYDDLKALRMKIAENAGFPNYRDFMHQAKGRFSYTPEDLFRFHEAVEKVVVPFVEELNTHRKEVLGLDVLRPWDLAVDLDGRKLKPFETTEEFISKAINILHNVKPEYALQLEMMNNTGLLDLENRKGKAPGGYNTGINNLASSFIFMNHVKLHNDVVTLLHEAGHAMHSAATKDIKLDYYCDTPSEVAELASMSMELLSMDYWDQYYANPADLNKAKRDQLQGTLSFLPWCMTVDAFQHWVYLHPEHTPQERDEAYIELNQRFSAGVDWSGLESFRKLGWMPQLHIFEVPFYYIEYGIAQLGALSVYMNYRRDPDNALKQYQSFLELGYQKPVREVYESAGIPFDFSEERIRELVAFVRQELSELGD